MKSKKLNIEQMECLIGGNPRACLFMGLLTFGSIALGPAAFLGAAMYTVAECS